LEINISEGLNLVLFSLILLFVEGMAAWWIAKKRKEMLGSFLVPATLIVFSLILWAVSRSFPDEDIGPIVIPQLWGSLTLLFCSYLIYTILRKKADSDPKTGNIKMLAVVVVLLLVYFFSMEIIGYFLSSFLFLGIMMYVLTYRNHKVIWTISAGWVLFSYIIFYKVLYIALPLGIIYETYFE
jgi:putative tricarboxylic transport membrane protein